MEYNFEEFNKQQKQAQRKRVAEARESETYKELVSDFKESIDKGYRGTRKDFFSKDQFIIQALKEDGFEVTYTPGSFLTSPYIAISIPSDKTDNIEHGQPFRDLMDKYQNRLYKIQKEYEEAKDDQDMDAIIAGEVLIKNMHAVISDLFTTMKRAKMLTKEEEEFGALKE